MKHDQPRYNASHEDNRELLNVLRAVRNVNQLITREKNKDILLNRACAILTETRGYRSAWIAETDTINQVISVHESNIGPCFEELRTRLLNGEWPACATSARVEKDLTVLHDPKAECAECPLSVTYHDTAALAAAIRYNNLEFGVLVVSLPRSEADVEEERSLVAEVAGDLALALYTIDMETRQREAESREAHIKQVLLAIRNVNQLIVYEEDPQRLIQKACENLTETLGYFNAWIALLDGKTERINATGSSGLNHQFDALRDRLNQKVFPQCMHLALQTDRTIIVHDPKSECSPCPLSVDYSSRSGMVRRLSFEDRIYGILTVSVPAPYADDQEEQNLFDEVARDLGFALDRIHVRRRLTESEQRFSQYIEHAPLGVFVTDQTGKYIDVNRTAERITGYSADQLRNISIPDLLPEESRSAGQAHFRRLLERGYSVGELSFRRASGEIGWWRVTASALGDNRFLGFVEDLTDQKMREERIRLLGRMIDEAPVSVTVHDTDGRFLFANGETLCMHGYVHEDEFLAINLHSLDVPESEALLAERFAEILEYGETRFEVSHFRKDGSSFPLEVSAKKIYWQGIQAVLSIASDITERKRAEEALRQSEERFRAANDASLDAILLFKSDRDKDNIIRDFIFVDLNRRTEEMLHLNREQLIGKRLCEVLPINHEAGFFDKYTNVVETGIPLEEEFFLPDTHVPSAWYYHQVVKVGDGIFICRRDISERKRAEEEHAKLQAQLLQSQKMESVGRLAGGVAHDFNNMIGIILGYGEMLLDQLHPSDPLCAQIQEIVQAARRSADLTRQLLAFARKQTLQPEVISINAIIRNFERMLGRIIGEDIELILDLGNDVGYVMADPGQIEQVITNLAVNARDAMPMGGKLEICTKSVVIDEYTIDEQSNINPGRYAVFSVSDTGHGIDKDLVSHIFEPFFTTKQMGRGTGLGLSTVYGIVTQSNGHIQVFSEIDKGTTFRVMLPVTDQQPSDTTQKLGNSSTEGTGQCILLVEDEEGLRKLLQRTLTRLGYNVTAASNGDDALLILNKANFKPDLILTDVVMPNMSGRELVDRFRAIHPDLKALYMSGYTDNVIVHHGILDSNTPFIHKPFTISNIAAKIREVLNL